MTKSGQPNVLLITADQWRGDCLSAMGHPVLRTPNIDRLAGEGVLFARHYAGSAPCSPGRACLYTGLYLMNHRVCINGTPLDRRHDNLALAARRAGYEPTLFGYTDAAADPRDYDAGDPLTNKFVDSRYIYLPGGPFSGWRNWGDRIGSYVRESLKLGMIPQFV